MEPNWAYFYAALAVLSGYLIYIPFFEFNKKFPGADEFYKWLQLYFEAVPETNKSK